ncbi:hypothetical protein P3U41_05465 [Mammaliicoccus sciuri]|uniref:hypothetical protein n=1 Tax=Mammaliicoccus TaxID=2803850 RepID=UPI001EFAFEE6|nr:MULTISPECIES: hypothetical protein [Mammaliicoccus]WQL34218.1 hypothetical protein P3U41_05465 [Mammaliicoccus sciuri]WQL61157.1 hypothetical protein P3T96_05465 [Mammaliicoccus sciuri]
MTDFTLIYDKFLSKLTDFSYLKLEKEVLESDLKTRLIIALSDFTTLDESKKEYDDYSNCFIEDLNVEEQEILARLMVVNYLDKFIFSEDLLKSSLNSKDYKQYSPTNLVKELRQLKSQFQSSVDTKMNAYSHSEAIKKARLKYGK